MAVELFPATVSTPSGSWTKVRVVTHRGRMLVFAASPGGVELIHHAAVALPAGDGGGPLPMAADPPRFPLRVATDEGEWTITPAGGCGCGSTLRSLSRSRLLELAGVTG